MAAPQATMDMLRKSSTPYFISVWAYQALYGISIVQAYDYFRSCSSDPWPLQLLASLVAALAFAQSICHMNTIWLRGVGQFGDLQSAIFNIPVSADIMTLTTTLTVFLCQLYFAHAAFRAVDSNLYIGAGLLAVILLSLAGGLGMSIAVLADLQDNFLSDGANTLNILPEIWLWGMAVAQILTTAVLALKLSVLKSKAGEWGSSMLTGFLTLSLRTGLFVVANVLFERICHLIGRNELALLPALINTVVFACTLFHTLNSRRKLATGMTDSGRVTTRFGGKSVKSQDEHIDLGVRNEVRVDTVVLREIEDAHGNRYLDKASDASAIGPFSKADSV